MPKHKITRGEYKSLCGWLVEWATRIHAERERRTQAAVAIYLRERETLSAWDKQALADDAGISLATLETIADDLPAAPGVPETGD